MILSVRLGPTRRPSDFLRRRNRPRTPLPAAGGNGLERRAARILKLLATTFTDETNAVAVSIRYVHLPVAPTLIRRFQSDLHPLRNEFHMQIIQLFDNQ